MTNLLVIKSGIEIKQLIYTVFDDEIFRNSNFDDLSKLLALGMTLAFPIYIRMMYAVPIPIAPHQQFCNKVSFWCDLQQLPSHNLNRNIIY